MSERTLWNIVGDPERYHEEKDAWIFIDYHTHRGSSIGDSRGLRRFEGSATLPLQNSNMSLKKSWSFKKKNVTDGYCGYVHRTFNKTSKVSRVNRVTQAVTRGVSPKERDEDLIWAYRGFS